MVFESEIKCTLLPRQVAGSLDMLLPAFEGTPCKPNATDTTPVLKTPGSSHGFAKCNAGVVFEDSFRSRSGFAWQVWGFRGCCGFDGSTARCTRLLSGDQISKKAAQHADYVKGFFCRCMVAVTVHLLPFSKIISRKLARTGAHTKHKQSKLLSLLVEG